VGKVEMSAGERTNVDIEALRSRIANLFDENPEKCLAFLDTLESNLIDDPFIRSIQQKALQARKDRSAEIILAKPKKRSGLISREKGIACPVCNTLNPLDNAYCSQCYSQLLQAPKSGGETLPMEPDASTPSPAQPGVRVKHRMRSVAEPALPPIPRRSTGQGTAKYYIGAAILCICLVVVGRWAFNNFFQPPPELPPIGTAQTDGRVDLLNQQGDIVSKLGDNTLVQIVQPLPGELSLNSIIRVAFANPQKKVLRGTLKLRDLKHLVIDGNPDLTLKHIELKYPISNTDPRDLRDYVDDAEKQIVELNSSTPSKVLLFEHASAYIRLAQNVDKGKPLEREDYRLAKGYLNRLPEGFNNVAALRKLCEDQLRPPVKQVIVSCADVLKTQKTNIVEAKNKYEDEQYLAAESIYDQILSANPSNCSKKEIAELNKMKTSAREKKVKIRRAKS
jgi:hypothetical protein